MPSRPVSALLLLVALSPASPIFAAAPEGYWAPADSLSGEALRVALHDIIDDHVVIPYSASGFDVHDAIDVLDEDPQDPTRVLLIYGHATAPKSSWPDYNREHLWPQSMGATEGTPAHTDLHHIRACDANVNSARNNKFFDECEDGCSSHPESPESLYDSDSWEPPDDQKGDIARALLYMDVRYEGGAEQDLVLGVGGADAGCDCMSELDVLLAWQALDPVDVAERERHEGVYDMQGNRNPFIDHPEWVCDLWLGATCPDEGEIFDPGEGDDIAAPPPSVAPWINEVHYDDQDADDAEGLEIAGPAGLSLTGWTAVLYNGNGGASYDTVELSGILPAEVEGWGALWFPAPGLQNGPSDGVALVDDWGAVVELLSWEGGLTAVGGPAGGMVAVPLPVSEGASTSSGQSLQRVGEGAEGAAFVWTGPSAASPGQINVGQTFPTSMPPEPTPSPVMPTMAPTPTASVAPTPTLESTPTRAPTPTLAPTPSAAPTPTAPPSLEPTPAPEPTPSAAAPTAPVTASPTPSATLTAPTGGPTAAPTPSAGATPTDGTGVVTPTATPPWATPTPTLEPIPTDGCSTAGGAGRGAGWLAAALVVVMRRRRR